jgi:hypothetical protein
MKTGTRPREPLLGSTYSLAFIATKEQVTTGQNVINHMILTVAAPPEPTVLSRAAMCKLVTLGRPRQKPLSLLVHPLRVTASALR